MEIVAKTRYAKSAPRKLRAVAKLVRQKNANEKGFVGYETILESFQKEEKYSTPKRP